MWVAKVGPAPPGIYAGASDYGTAGGILTRCQLLEGQTQLRVRLMLKDPIHVLDVFCGDLPDLGRSLDQLTLDVLGRLIAGPSGFESHAAAAGIGRETDGVGIRYLGLHVFHKNPQHLSELLGDGDPGAADVR